MRSLGLLRLTLQKNKRNLMTVEYSPSLQGSFVSWAEPGLPATRTKPFVVKALRGIIILHQQQHGHGAPCAGAGPLHYRCMALLVSCKTTLLETTDCSLRERTLYS